MTRKVALYTRVSTEEQHPENQIEQLKTFCSEQNFKVEKIYIDKMSGRVTDRPQFQQMLKDARLKQFDILIVWSLDRFSREGTQNTRSYIERLKRYNVGFISYSEPIIDTTKGMIGELVYEIVLVVMSYLAKKEAEKVSERTKAGLERAKANGKKLGRPKGSKDKKPRDNFNYKKRWRK